MSEYPIYVYPDFDLFHPADTLVCWDCDRERKATADEIVSGAESATCRCGSLMDFKYAVADHRCGGCGTLGFFPDTLGNNCSRVCMLQAEYASSLGRAA